MGTIRCGDCLDGDETQLIVDDLHPLGLADGDGAGVHPQEDAVMQVHTTVVKINKHYKIMVMVHYG